MTTIHDIDWFIFEDPNTAFSYIDNQPLDEETKSKVAIPLSSMTMVFPTSRYSERFVNLPVEGPCNIIQTLNIIHDFYMKDVDKADVQNLDDGYSEEVLKTLQLGGKAKMYELLGLNGIGPFGEAICYDEDQPRRHPLMCNGLVRFEGLIIEGTTVHVILGS